MKSATSSRHAGFSATVGGAKAIPAVTKVGCCIVDSRLSGFSKGRAGRRNCHFIRRSPSVKT